MELETSTSSWTPQTPPVLPTPLSAAEVPLVLAPGHLAGLPHWSLPGAKQPPTGRAEIGLFRRHGVFVEGKQFPELGLYLDPGEVGQTVLPSSGGLGKSTFSAVGVRVY